MPNNSTHPLYLTAAAAVIITCSVAVASMTGILPSTNAEQKATAEQTEAEKLAAEKAKQDELVAQAKIEQETKKVAPKPAVQRVVSSQPTYAKAAICNSCGQVSQVRAVQKEGQGSGAGAVAGGVTGAVIGKQFGNGSGQKAMTVLGAIGGAILGNHIEKQTRTVQTYEVIVAFRDGSTGTFQFEQQPYWQPGDRVKVVNGQLTADI